MTEKINIILEGERRDAQDEAVNSKAGSVSPDEIDLLIAEQLRNSRPLSEIDLQSLEESNRRVCEEILRRKKPNASNQSEA